MVDITFGVNFLLHLWLTVRSVSYYIWCKFFITFVVDITFGVNFLLHLRLILHLVYIFYYICGWYYIWCRFFITFVVGITFGVSYYIWCCYTRPISAMTR